MPGFQLPAIIQSPGKIVDYPILIYEPSGAKYQLFYVISAF